MFEVQEPSEFEVHITFCMFFLIYIYDYEGYVNYLVLYYIY